MSSNQNALRVIWKYARPAARGTDWVNFVFCRVQNLYSFWPWGREDSVNWRRSKYLEML